jgi:hypothetical protein
MHYNHQTVGIPFSEKTKDGQVFLEYHEEDVQDHVMEAVIRQAYRMFTVSNGLSPGKHLLYVSVFTWFHITVWFSYS